MLSDVGKYPSRSPGTLPPPSSEMTFVTVVLDPRVALGLQQLCQQEDDGCRCRDSGRTLTLTFLRASTAGQLALRRTRKPGVTQACRCLSCGAPFLEVNPGLLLFPIYQSAGGSHAPPMAFSSLCPCPLCGPPASAQPLSIDPPPCSLTSTSASTSLEVKFPSSSANLLLMLDIFVQQVSLSSTQSPKCIL